MKYWRLNWDEAMDDVSWQNELMLNAVIPSYNDSSTGSPTSSAVTGGSISFFDFGKQLSGIN